MNHYTAFNLTKLDVLDAFESIEVCTAYKDPATNENLPAFPASVQLLEKVECVYQTLPGWGGKLGGKVAGVKNWEDLPPNAKDYVLWIEKETGVKIKFIGTGPGRDDLIVR